MHRILRRAGKVELTDERIANLQSGKPAEIRSAVHTPATAMQIARSGDACVTDLTAADTPGFDDFA